MPRLPRLSGRDVVNKLKRAGYIVVRKHGSHVRLHHSDRPSTTIPMHSVLGPGLLRKILRDTNLTPQEFIDL